MYVITLLLIKLTPLGWNWSSLRDRRCSHLRCVSYTTQHCWDNQQHHDWSNEWSVLHVHVAHFKDGCPYEGIPPSMYNVYYYSIYSYVLSSLLLQQGVEKIKHHGAVLATIEGYAQLLKSAVRANAVKAFKRTIYTCKQHMCTNVVHPCSFSTTISQHPTPPPP